MPRYIVRGAGASVIGLVVYLLFIITYLGTLGRVVGKWRVIAKNIRISFHCILP